MENKKIIFWGCSMKGGYPKVTQADLAEIVSGMKKMGYSLTSEHQVGGGTIKEENKLAPKEIHDRDYDWLVEAEAEVFEISNPSLGVGAEIADMLHLGKPVLCLYRGNEGDVSAYVRGKESSSRLKSNLVCRRYETVEDALEIIKAFVEGLS